MEPGSPHPGSPRGGNSHAPDKPCLNGASSCDANESTPHRVHVAASGRPSGVSRTGPQLRRHDAASHCLGGFVASRDSTPIRAPIRCARFISARSLRAALCRASRRVRPPGADLLLVSVSREREPSEKADRPLEQLRSARCGRTSRHEPGSRTEDPPMNSHPDSQRTASTDTAAPIVTRLDAEGSDSARYRAILQRKIDEGARRAAAVLTAPSRRTSHETRSFPLEPRPFISPPAAGFAWT